MSCLSKRDKELVAIGAAVGSNCVPCVVFHLKEAKDCGITDAELTEVIELADKLKKVPSKLVLNAANEEINGAPVEPEASTDCRSDCGC